MVEQNAVGGRVCRETASRHPNSPFAVRPDRVDVDVGGEPRLDLFPDAIFSMVRAPYASDAPMLSLSLEQGGALVAGYPARPRPFRAAESGHSVLPAEFVIFESIEQQTFINRPSKLVATLKDGCGQTASATSEVTVVDVHPG